MISANDTTILAVLSCYPNITSEEADAHIANIEQKEIIPICHAVIGRIDKSALNNANLRIFDEFQRWSEERTRRVRNEQQTARIRQQETRLAVRLNELHAQGRISDQVLLMYGISGELPERRNYQAMTPEEKEILWGQRLERRLGPNWSQRIGRNTALPLGFIRNSKIMLEKPNWIKEGF